MEGGQPAQKWFETQLAAALDACTSDRPVWCELEHTTIGKIFVPPTVMDEVLKGPRFEVCMPMEHRVASLLEDYQELGKDIQQLKGLLKFLEKFQGKDRIAYWEKLVDEQNGTVLVQDLLELHYDPAYKRSQAKAGNKFKSSKTEIAVPGHSVENLDQTVQALVEAAKKS